MEVSSQLSQYEYALKRIKDTFHRYVKLLSPITELQLGDKIAWFSTSNDAVELENILTSTIEINKPTYFNSFYRWYYAQGRDKTINNLSVIRQHYVKLMNDVYYGCYMTNIYQHYIHFAREMIEFNAKLLYGLLLLRNTYNDPNMNSIIDTIDKTMIDFKINVAEIRTKRNVV
jgi:hypothetical protein